MVQQQAKSKGKHLFNVHSLVYNIGCRYYRKCDSNAASSSSKLYKAPNESMLGRKLMMKFNVNHKPQWFKGIVNAYDGLTGKYGVYFPYDKQTVYIREDDRHQICNW